MRLRIAKTWDGEPVDETEPCEVALTSTEACWIIEVHAPFHGDPPPPEPPGSLDGLWTFEVVELFVAAAEAGQDDANADYTEIELSPHGHHLVLRFSGVRKRQAVVEPLAVRCRITEDRWHGRIELPRDALPSQPWRTNAFAMHGLGESRRHLAAAPLPGAGPDFHQPGLFPRFPS